MATNTAGSQTLGTSSAAIYTGECGSFSVYNRAGSSGYALINIPGLHAAADWFPIAPGTKEVFRNSFQAIRTVNAKTDTNGAVIDCGVTIKGSPF